MTLSSRNGIFKAGIVLASSWVLAAVFASFTLMAVYSDLAREVSRRSAGFFDNLVSPFLQVNLYAVHVSISAATLYALVVLILIYLFFETTQCPEILFIALFAGSLSFEAARFILPLGYYRSIPSLYLLLAFRSLIFSRYFGLFSLFIASVCAAGLDIRKQRNMLLIITAAALIIALGVPIDTGSWDSSLNMVNGYLSLFRLIESTTVLITIISFLIAARFRGSREYIFISAGAFLALTGRNLLLGADTWAALIPGIGFLSAGMWFICTRLHKIYLWL